MNITDTAHHEIHTVTPRSGVAFERVFLYCPEGHEVASAPAWMPMAQQWAAGDYSGESCGYGSCEWGHEA